MRTRQRGHMSLNLSTTNRLNSLRSIRRRLTLTLKHVIIPYTIRMFKSIHTLRPRLTTTISKSRHLKRQYTTFTRQLSLNTNRNRPYLVLIFSNVIVPNLLILSSRFLADLLKRISSFHKRRLINDDDGTASSSVASQRQVQGEIPLRRRPFGHVCQPGRPIDKQADASPG